MADPVSDVVSVQDKDKADADAEDEVTAEPDPDRRLQMRLVVLVVVLYLVCQTLMIYFVKSNKSAIEYSNDVKFLRNQTKARASDLDCMRRFCDRPDMDQDEEEASGRESSLLESSDAAKKTEGPLLSTNVLNVIEKRLKKADMWCGIKVTYYVCNSKFGPYNYVFNAFDESFDVELRNESYPLSKMMTFVDDSLGFDIVIAYSECPDYIRPESMATFPDLFIIDAVKIASPLPILSALAVYFYLPQLQNLQGKILICRLLSDLVYSTWPRFVEDGKPNLILVCSCVAGITWTTIMCYELWSALSNCLPPASGRNRHGQKFVYYSLIGWGHPALFGTVLVLAKLTLLSQGFEILLVVALYVIYFFLNLLNVLFFTFTVKNIKKHNARNLSLVKKGRQGKTAAKGLNLYFRISALMGIISFIFENVDICMIIFANYNDRILRTVLLGFSFLDNMLYFIILVCNKRVLRLLQNKWKSKSMN